MERISFHGDLSEALVETDLVLEAVPESLNLKKRVFRGLEKNPPQGVILAGNSSSIPVCGTP
jgi:3-hydroxyacyl-CoA dehydrogenase